MIRQSIARSYAKGLFAAGVKDGSYKDYLRQIKEILEIVDEAPRIRKALALPLFEMDKRKELLSGFMAALDVSPPVAALLGHGTGAEDRRVGIGTGIAIGADWRRLIKGDRGIGLAGGRLALAGARLASIALRMRTEPRRRCPKAAHEQRDSKKRLQHQPSNRWTQSNQARYG